MMRFMEKAEQAKIVDAGDEAVAVVRSPAFAPFVPLFAAVRFDVLAWADDMARTTAAARQAHGERESTDDFYRDEAREVRELTDRFEHWVRRLQAAARAIATTDHPFAPRASLLFRLERFQGGSTENTHYGARALLNSVIELGDLSAIGLPATFADEAKALYDAFVPERGQVASRGFQRVTATSALHAYLDHVVDLMERFARYREFAMLMSGEEIPEFGLAVIRSSLAGRPDATDSGASAAAPEPTLTV